MKNKIGTFTSVWDDGSEITTPAALNLKTGELEVTQSKKSPKGSLEREYFEDKDGEEYEVCDTCHSYIMKAVMNPGMGHDLNEEQECSDPDCDSHQ
jgi:hypothetical protein